MFHACNDLKGRAKSSLLCQRPVNLTKLFNQSRQQGWNCILSIDKTSKNIISDFFIIILQNKCVHYNKRM